MLLSFNLFNLIVIKLQSHYAYKLLMIDDCKKMLVLKLKSLEYIFLWIFIFRCKFFDTFFLPAASLKSNPRHCLLSKETFQLFFMHWDTSFHHLKTHRLIIAKLFDNSFKRNVSIFLMNCNTSFHHLKTYRLIIVSFQKKRFNSFNEFRHLISSFQNSPTYHRLLSKETFQLFFMHCDTSFHHFKTDRLLIVSFQKKRFNCFFNELRHLISSYQNSPTYNG
jgi:hypothetical protein